MQRSKWSCAVCDVAFESHTKSLMNCLPVFVECSKACVHGQQYCILNWTTTLLGIHFDLETDTECTKCNTSMMKKVCVLFHLPANCLLYVYSKWKFKLRPYSGTWSTFSCAIIKLMETLNIIEKTPPGNYGKWLATLFLVCFKWVTQVWRAKCNMYRTYVCEWYMLQSAGPGI